VWCYFYVIVSCFFVVLALRRGSVFISYFIDITLFNLEYCS